MVRGGSLQNGSTHIVFVWPSADVDRSPLLRPLTAITKRRPLPPPRRRLPPTPQRVTYLPLTFPAAISSSDLGRSFLPPEHAPSPTYVQPFYPPEYAPPSTVLKQNGYNDDAVMSVNPFYDHTNPQYHLYRDTSKLYNPTQPPVAASQGSLAFPPTCCLEGHYRFHDSSQSRGAEAVPSGRPTADPPPALRSPPFHSPSNLTFSPNSVDEDLLTSPRLWSYWPAPRSIPSLHHDKVYPSHPETAWLQREGGAAHEPSGTVCPPRRVLMNYSPYNSGPA